MVNELIPWVDGHFRTLADRDHRAMAGLSMAACKPLPSPWPNLDKFSHIGFFSGGAATGAVAVAAPLQALLQGRPAARAAARAGNARFSRPSTTGPWPFPRNSIGKSRSSS